MKLLYLCNEYPPAQGGGIGTFVGSVAPAMAARGHSVTVLELGDAPGERHDGFVRVVTLRRSQLPVVGGLVDRVRLYDWMHRAAHRREFDLVEIPDYHGLLPFPFGATPVVVRLHNTATAIARHAGTRLGRDLALFERLTLRLHRDWIAVSRFIEATAVETFGVRPRRSRVIYNPAPPTGPTATARPAVPGRFVMFAGHVAAQKGVLVLAEAARRFLADDPALHLLLVGAVAADDRGGVDGQIRAIVGPELACRVHFTGYVTRDRVLAYMRQAALFVLPSTFESFSLTVVEAMQVGTPVVAFDAGPLPEYVTHAETGMLIPPNDAAALAASIRTLLADVALARRIADRARALVTTRFRLDRCVEESLRYYEECLSGIGPDECRHEFISVRTA